MKSPFSIGQLEWLGLVVLPGTWYLVTWYQPHCWFFISWGTMEQLLMLGYCLIFFHSNLGFINPVNIIQSLGRLWEIDVGCNAQEPSRANLKPQKQPNQIKPKQTTIGFRLKHSNSFCWERINISAFSGHIWNLSWQIVFSSVETTLSLQPGQQSTVKPAFLYN